MNLGLKNRLILVAGSSKGIGKAVINSFLEEGAIVVITGRNKKDVEQAYEHFLEKYGVERVSFYVGDLLKETEITNLQVFLREKWGYLDHLVCNLGSGKSVPPLTETREEWQKMLDVNLLGATLMVRKLTELLELGVERTRNTSSITFISSICGKEVIGCPIAYSSAKAALEAYAKNISRPLARRDIRVNVVSPGNIIFPGSTWEKKLADDEKAVKDMLDREVPLNRLGTAREVADTVAFLASNKASFICGTNLTVDGGQCRGV